MLSRREMGALCASLLFCLLLSLGAGWAQSQLTTADQLSADTLRLHIRADTDSVRDQSAKLAVRDAVLVLTDEACPADSRADARAWAAENLVRFELTARQTLASLGIRAPVKACLVNMYFPTRRYDGGALPAGRYDALRIQIGAGTGRNWWCVLYPSLCYTDAIHAVVPDSSKKTLSSLLAEDDYDALLSPLDRTKQPQQKPEVRVRFRLMDLFHKKS